MKAVGNIGAGGLGVILHPYNTLKSAGRMALEANPIAMGYHYLTGTPSMAEEMGQQFKENPYGMVEAGVGQAGAAPVLGAEARVATAPVRAIPSILKGGADILAGTTPKIATELGQKTLEENTAAQAKADTVNAKAAQEHQAAIQDALEEQKGRELGYKHALKTKEAELQTQGLSEVNQAAADHAAEVQTANEHNQRVMAKHQQAVQRITESNKAAEQTAAMRSQATEDLAKKTQAYYDKEDAAKSQAKATENAAWQPWREKMQDATIDGSEITEPLKKLAVISPEVTRTIHQLTPSPEEAAPDSMYAQDRAAIMKSQGYKGDYWDLAPEQRVQVDHIAASSGFEPEPIDFDPQAGKQIPVEQVHRANSILQRYISSGRFEGPLLGEMKQVAKVLRAAVSRASDANGALDDLNAARQETIKYQQAFGRDRHMPTTQDEVREKTANPEAYREREDQARLDAASRVDPTLVDAYQGVKASREALKKLPTEDQLRKGQKQVPTPPTVGDLREGYRLKPIPKPPQKLLATPVSEVAKQTVKQPELPNFENRPPLSVAETKKIGLKDIQQAKEDALTNRKGPAGGKLGHLAGGAGGWHFVMSAMHGSPEGMVFGGSVMAAPYVLARVFKSPAIIKMLSNPTPADIASIPPEVRGELPAIINEAQKQGIRVHPAILSLSQPNATQQ